MPIPILAYHQIDSPAEHGSPFRRLTVDPANFLRQMTWLKRTGWTGMSMRMLKPYLIGAKVGKVVGITFDDGFRNVYSNALPVLERLDFTATAYFVSRQVGGFNQWDATIGVPYSACMSREDILEWAKLGHEVGCHTLDHSRLTAVGKDEATRQITDARHQLEDLLGGPVDSFSYPYGAVTTQVRNMVAEAGYSSAMTTVDRRSRYQDDKLLLPRRVIYGTDGWVNVLRKCLTG